MAHAIDQKILAVAATQDQIVTRGQLNAAGVSNGSLNRRRGTLLVPAAPGVYSIGPLTDRGLIRAALLANPAGALADVTAAELLELPARRSTTRSIVVPHGTGVSVDHPQLVVRRTTHLPVDDIDEADLRRTTVERTICDLAARQDPQQTKRLIEWGITHRRMTPTSFHACLRHYCRRGRPGSALLRLFDSELLDGRPIPASELERRGVEALERGGLTGWELHFTPPWSDGVSGIVDIAFPDRQLIVELDGRRWHAMTSAMRNDRHRDRRAAQHGWTVLRFGWAEVVERPRSFINEIRTLLVTPPPISS